MTSDEIIQWMKEKRNSFPEWDDRYEDLDNLIAELQEEIETRAAKSDSELLEYFCNVKTPTA